MDSQERIESAAKLEALGRNLTKLAEENKLGLVYERHDEIKVLATLLSTGANNVILVGDSGVGKNAIVEGLARWIIGSKKSDASLSQLLSSNYLSDLTLIETSADYIQSSCFYVHEFETKIKLIIEECKKNKAILFIDNINLIITAGAYSDAPERNLANLLNRHLSGREIQIIGATTPEGYSAMLKRNPRFTQRFVKMNVPPMTPKQTVLILRKLKSTLEDRYKIKFSKESIKVLVDLSERFFPERVLPGKVFYLMREVIAAKLLANRRVTEDDIYQLIKDKTGFPEFIIHRGLPIDRKKIIKYFATNLFGQDHVFGPVVNTILQYKSELNNPTKPIGTFLLAGPTGVGKSELAKLLAAYLFGSEEKLLRYDMANYSSYNAAHRLFEGEDNSESGQLFSDINANPYSVILFDEIEKANSIVFNYLLAILGEGQLISSIGRVVYFTNTIIIMTSNLGAYLYSKKPIGLSNSEVNVGENDILKNIKMRFSPEFINRINYIIYFKPLFRDAIKQIIYREIGKLSDRKGLSWRDIKIDIDVSVIDKIIDDGYNQEYGARAIQRAITGSVIDPLAALLGSNPAVRNNKIYFTLKDSEIHVRPAKSKLKSIFKI